METWQLIDHYLALGCEISFKRNFGQIEISMQKKKDGVNRLSNQVLPDDHMPSSLGGVLDYMYKIINP